MARPLFSFSNTWQPYWRVGVLKSVYTGFTPLYDLPESRAFRPFTACIAVDCVYYGALIYGRGVFRPGGWRFFRL